MHRFILSAALAVSLSASAAMSEAARIITWDDLVPVAAPLKNPFEDLSQDVKDELSLILRGRQDLEDGFIEAGGENHEALQGRERKLTDKGIDIDGLLAKLVELTEELERRNEQVVPELEGEIVRLPGYALPLEFTEGGIKEFLLVPYVGACIHTPPPPPNQMVYVQLDEEFVLDNLYEPVWITGRLKTEQASRSLSFVDGQSDVPTGYAMNATLIEPYQ